MAGMHEEFQKWPHVQRVAGRRWFVPRGYDPGNFKDFKKPRHDMGLVELERPLEYNEFVQPACLPPEGSESPPNERCTLAGMGMTDKRRYSMHLLALPLKPCPRQLPVFPDETCYITADPERFPGTACSGDSGSAVMCPNDAAPGDRAARFYAIGITSWKTKEPCEAGSVEEIYLADMRKKRSLLLDLLKKLAETSGRVITMS